MAISTELCGQDDPYKRRLVHEIPIRFPGYTTVLSTKGYSYLFPQGMGVYENRIYILYGGVISSSGAGSWVSVHDLATGAYISGFGFGTEFGEGLTIKREGGNLYLYAVIESNQLGKFNIETLPVDLATITPVATYAIRAFSQFCWDGDRFTIQTLARANAPSTPRNHFTRYDSSLNFHSRLTFDPADQWSVASDLVSLNPKSQGIAAYRGGYVIGYGSTHNDNDPVTSGRYTGLRMFTDTGLQACSGMMDPNRFIDVLQAAGCTVSLLEMEALAEYQDALYCLWVTSSHTNTGNHGIVITQELVGDMDCYPAALTVTGQPCMQPINGTIDHDANGLKNPLTNSVFSTLEQIIEFMRDTQLTRYGFYTSNSTIADLNGNNLPSGGFVEIITGNYLSWLVSFRATQTEIEYWINGTQGALSQSTRIVRVGGTLPPYGDEFIVLGASNGGRVAFGRIGTGDAIVQEFYNANGLVGHIRVNGSATRYFVTSNRFITGGNGSPNGIVAANPGSLYLRQDGGAGTCLYVKESGGSTSTGWVAK